MVDYDPAKRRKIVSRRWAAQERGLQMFFVLLVLTAPLLRGRFYVSQIVFTFTKARAPQAPSSRPYPLCLIPPKGNSGDERTKSFTKTAPASICGMSRC